MADASEQIIAQARDLGKAIAAHPRCRDFLAAARAVAEDHAAQDALRAYQEHAIKIRGLEASGKPIEPDDKRKIAELERTMASNEKLKAMMKHQADYLELMHRVNAAMDEGTQAEPS